MAVTNIKSKASDAYIWEDNAVYNTCWVDATGIVAGAIDNASTGQQHAAGDFYIYRVMLLFDTSSMIGVTINSAKLWLYQVNLPSFDNDWKLQIQSDGLSPQVNPEDPPIMADFNKALYAGDGGQSAFASTWPVPGWFDIDLTPAGLGWIDQTGSLTRLVLRSTREIAGTAPGAGEQEKGTINQGDKLGKEPYLAIDYTAAAGGGSGPNLLSARLVRGGRRRV